MEHFRAGRSSAKIACRCGSGSVSPDGRQVIFLRGGKFDHSEIWLAGTDGREPRVAVEVSGFAVGAPAWSPDSQRFAYLKDVYWPGSSTEDVQIEMYDLASERAM